MHAPNFLHQHGLRNARSAVKCFYVFFEIFFLLLFYSSLFFSRTYNFFISSVKLSSEREREKKRFKKILLPNFLPAGDYVYTPL